MAGVGGTHCSLVSGMVDLVELRVADTDVQPIVEPGEVGGLAGGAEILQVLRLVLHLLEYPVLPGGTVLVEYWLERVRVWLPIGADLTLGRAGTGQDGRHPLVPDTDHCTTLSTH